MSSHLGLWPPSWVPPMHRRIGEPTLTGVDSERPVGSASRAELVGMLTEIVAGLGAGGGESPFDDPVLDIQVGDVRYQLIRSEEPKAVPHLSAREQEIARMVAAGRPNKTIAKALEISEWTVSTHLRRIFAKLGVSSRAAMVARLLSPGALLPGWSNRSNQNAGLLAGKTWTSLRSEFRL